VTAAAFLFAHDLLDETPEVLLDRLEQAGMSGAVMAAAYHHSRDVFPHNPRHHVVYLEGGTVYFHADRPRYAALAPRVAAVAEAADPLAVLCQATESYGLSASAWLVVLHNTRLAMEAPRCAPQTALGDSLLNSLCPANPESAAFAEALAADVARYKLESIKLEALSYMPFDHGYHHERSFVPLSPNVRFLLGVCFCEHCLARARSLGVDAERVRQWTARQITNVLESAAGETQETDIEEARLRAACDGDVGRYLEMRCQVVTSLAERVTGAVHAVSPDTRVVFLDLSGAALGYATGRPLSHASATSIGWRDGVDPAALGQVCDGVGMLGYFADSGRLEAEVRAYQALLSGGDLEVLLRPMPPDSVSAEELADKVAVLRSLGVGDLGFYHYGMMRLEALEWIARALGDA
jgi:hypothetical protein